MRKFEESRLTEEQLADLRRAEFAVEAWLKKDPEASKALLARDLGVSPAVVSQILSGKRPPNENFLIAVAKRTGVPLEQISPTITSVVMDKLRAVSKSARVRDGGSSSELRRWHTTDAKIRGIAAMNEQAEWQWNDLQKDDGLVPWNRSGCFAIKIVGDALHPRYKSGEYLILDENEAPQPDSDVLVVLTNGTALIRELVYVREDAVALRSQRGDRQTIPASQVDFINTVVGRASPTQVIKSR